MTEAERIEALRKTLAVLAGSMAVWVLLLAVLPAVARNLHVPMVAVVVPAVAMEAVAGVLFMVKAFELRTLLQLQEMRTDDRADTGR